MDDPLCNSENVLRYEIYIPYSQKFNSFAACTDI